MLYVSAPTRQQLFQQGEVSMWINVMSNMEQILLLFQFEPWFSKTFIVKLHITRL